MSYHIKQLRVQAQLTQKELAKKAGISQSFLTKIERGLVKPSHEIVLALESAIHQNQTVLAKDICTNTIISVKPHNSVKECIDIFISQHVSQSPVMDQNAILG
ncbi:MAG: helix-turn-helix domain-containing protein, partial [Candidatus Woesearchaeota archaeon]